MKKSRIFQNQYRFEGKIFECCHHTLSFSPLLSGLMRDILRFICFIFRHEKLLFFFLFFLRLLFTVWACYCLILRFCWLQSFQYAKIVNYYSALLEVNTRQRICCRYTPCGTPTFFCARHGFLGKMFFNFYLKTWSDTGIICGYGWMFFSLRFNVFFPDNDLFFREMVIRCINMQILVVCARIVL